MGPIEARAMIFRLITLPLDRGSARRGAPFSPAARAWSLRVKRAM